MKLYTEEQVIKAIDLSRLQGAESYLVKYREEEILNMITPIQLPSDEEIDTHAHKEHDDSFNEFYTYTDGAKWLKQQILNQNK